MIEMINAGVSGNSTADALQRMDADVLARHPLNPFSSAFRQAPFANFGK